MLMMCFQGMPLLSMNQLDRNLYGIDTLPKHY